MYSARQLAKSVGRKDKKSLSDFFLIALALQDKKVASFLNNPLRKMSDKEKMLEEIFKQKVDEENLNFIKFLLRENSLNIFEKILENYKNIFIILYINNFFLFKEFFQKII